MFNRSVKMSKIIIIFLLCVTAVSLERINSRKFRFVGTFNDMGLSSSGIEYPSSNSGVTSRSSRLTRAKRSPLMYLVPVNEEHENADNEMTERSRPSRKIKRCKTALCKAGNIPLSGEYGDGMVKATAGESSGESYGRSNRWKQIRTAKNSVVSKLFKKETDSSENDDDNDELVESLGKNLANEQNYENYPSNRKHREKLGKFVCYCQREDCPNCQSLDSKKELVGAPRTKENNSAKDKFKKDRYRKLLRPNDYVIPKIPLVRLPELYREIPYDLRRNRGNANKMDILPIVRGIPPNVHPLTAPFRVAYDPADSYLGISGPVSQQYQQKFNNIYQHVPFKQHTVASKSKSDIPRRPSVSMSENNDVGSKNNNFTTVKSPSEENNNDQNVDPEESIEDNAFDSNMQECIKLFGKKVCVLAASTNCDNLNKVKNQKNNNVLMGTNKNVGSAYNYYETSSTEQSSTYREVNEDYYDATESDMHSNDSPYNIINGEDMNDQRISTEQSLENYFDDYYDSTLAYLTSETPDHVTNDIKSPKYMNIDSTEAAMLGITSNQNEETTAVLTDINLNNTVDDIEHSTLNLENKSSTYDPQNQNDYIYEDFTSTTAATVDETSTDTIVGNYYIKETHPGLDYSDIHVVTNSYFTSKGYDESDENYFTGFDPSPYDYHMSNDGSTNFLHNSPSSDTNLQATNVPGIIKDQSNLAGIVPTRNYADLAKSRFFTDLTVNDDSNIDKTAAEDSTDLLEKASANCEGHERKMNDQEKESALQNDGLDLAIMTTIESQETTTDSSFETDDYVVGEAILTTEKNSVKHQFSNGTVGNKENTTVTTVSEKNVSSTVGFTDKSFSRSTDSMMDEENSLKNFSTTSNPITVDDSELESSEEVSNNLETESTTQDLPFCDNTVLINAIKKVLNKFTIDPGSLEEEPYTSTDIDNDKLSPEILEIPNLQSFLSLPKIENVIVKNVKDHLLKFVGLPKNALTGTRPIEVIRNTLRNIFGVLPKTEPELPPMSVMEHQFRNDEWTTTLVTLAPSEPDDKMENHNSLQNMHQNIKDLIFNPAVGLEAAKQNAVQNIIVQAIKHEIENANNMAVEEDTIRDMVGSILGNAFEEEQNESEENSFEISTIMENTTKRLEEENNYDEATTTESNILEDFLTNFEHDNEATTELYTEAFVGDSQIAETEVNEKNNNSKDDPNLNKVKSTSCLSQKHSNQIMTAENQTIDINPTAASFAEDFVGSVQLLTTEISKETNDSNANQDLSRKKPVDYANRVNSELVTIAIPVTSSIIDAELTTLSSTKSYPESSTTQINEETDSTDSPNLGEEITDAINIESTTIAELSSTEINDEDDDSSTTTTNSYTENFQDDNHIQSTDVSETTKDITNINEEATLRVPYENQPRSSETTKKNKGETNESEVLRLPQNSFVGAGNTGIGESSSVNQGRSSQGKEKCRLCKVESCTSTHEIVTKVHKRVKTTTKKYYGAKENVASEGNSIVSSKHQEEERNTAVSLESQEDINPSKNHDDDVLTTCENLSDENSRDSESDEDIVYKEKISKKKTYGDNNEDDLSDLQNSELYYIGDNVKLPLEITKLKDGSYALSISKSICENILQKNCPCCVPLDGNVRSVRKSPAINGNTRGVVGTRKSTGFKPKAVGRRPRRSTNKDSNWDNSILKNEFKTLTMPVMSFAKKYNLRLNLNDEEIENTTAKPLKRTNIIEKDNINVGSKEPLIERSNEIARDKNKFEEENDIYRDDDDRVNSIDKNNPVFQRMKFVNRIRQNPELYRRQRDIEIIPNDKTEILKSLLNWLRTLILH